MSQTVKEFFEEIEDRDEIINLGGGSCFIFCGTAKEWDTFGKTLNKDRAKKLKDDYESAKKAFDLAKKRMESAMNKYLSAAKALEKFRPFMDRLIVEDYVSTTGNHCVIFEGDDTGWFWNRKEFEIFMKTGKFPKDAKKEEE